MKTLAIDTEYGTFLARYSNQGLAELRFPDDSALVSVDSTHVPARWHELTTAAVLGILNGEEPDALPPFDLSAHTEFRRRVWNILQQIPAGETLTYSEVASHIGQPSASRAVGGACGANPIPLLIPCHRVLGSSHSLTGFSGGLHWKRRLLAIEGVLLSDETVVASRQLSLEVA